MTRNRRPIFGAMFQGVMDEEMRYDLGAHYTSEENILKVIRPLFLDRLREEFDVIAGTSHAEGAENAEAENPIRSPLRSPRSPREKIIYDGDAVIRAKNINCYLMDAPDIIISSRNAALCDVPKMVYGNKPTDGGNLFLTPEERDAFFVSALGDAPCGEGGTEE